MMSELKPITNRSAPPGSWFHVPALSTGAVSPPSKNVAGIVPPPSAPIISARKADLSTPEMSEVLFSARATLKVLTSQVSMHLPAQWRQRLFSKLDGIYDPDEWVSGDKLIDPASFWTFLRMILQYGPGGRPGLGASSRGNLIAAWSRADGQLTLEFVPDDQIFWIAVMRNGATREQAAGNASLDRLGAVLQPYMPPDWFRDEG